MTTGDGQGDDVWGGGDPSPSGGDGGRDGRGRFATGNTASRGNPHAQAVGRLRAALLGAVTPDDLSEIVVALVAKAKAGDVAAAREVLDRCLGKVPQAVAIKQADREPDRIIVIPSPVVKNMAELRALAQRDPTAVAHNHLPK